MILWRRLLGHHGREQHIPGDDDGDARDAQQGEDGVPQSFHLSGAGWGHGVGLCQIGAAMMGEKGYDHEAILRHYYPGATLKTLYKPSIEQ